MKTLFNTFFNTIIHKLYDGLWIRILVFWIDPDPVVLVKSGTGKKKAEFKEIWSGSDFYSLRRIQIRIRIRVNFIRIRNPGCMGVFWLVENMKIQNSISYCLYFFGWTETGQCIEHTACPKSLDPFYKITFYIKLVKTSWTYITIEK